MPYLSRLVLDLRQREVQRDLADCQRLHGRVMRAFPAVANPTNAREQFGVLFRAEPRADKPVLRLLVQSNHLPDWSVLPPHYLAATPDERGNPAVRIIDDYAHIQTGMRMRFRLRANPTKRINDRSTRPEDVGMRGKRVELRHEADQLAWLERKGQAGGFRLVQVAVESDAPIPNVRVGDRPHQRGQRGDQRMHFGVAVFDGLLDVTDRDAFVSCLHAGVGSGKAYGFGLLSVAQIPYQVPA